MHGRDGWSGTHEPTDGVVAHSERPGQEDRIGALWTRTSLVRGGECSAALRPRSRR